MRPPPTCWRLGWLHPLATGQPARRCVHPACRAVQIEVDQISSRKLLGHLAAATTVCCPHQGARGQPARRLPDCPFHQGCNRQSIYNFSAKFTDGQADAWFLHDVCRMFDHKINHLNEHVLSNVLALDPTSRLVDSPLVTSNSAP